jgi:phosphatidylethanolamine/phosphatidyl-N-methylethanolamine N-methyltransferase
MSWTFFREFLCNWKATGALAPSSPALARRVVETAKVAQARSVLELGPGMGAFTREISEAMSPDAHYLGLELNNTFVQRLRCDFPEMKFEAVPAQEFDFDTFLGSEGSFDSIVSGLPWTAFPESLQIAILDHVLTRLRPGGTFVTFAYTGFHLVPSGQRFRTLLRSRCDELTTTPTIWQNFLPAFVYSAKKPG